MIERRIFAIEGIVQGVGFRPFVHRLATTLDLRGFVKNDASGVTIDVEGDDIAIAEFNRSLAKGPPFPADILRIREKSAAPAAYTRFSIEESDDAVSADTAATALVSPDIAACADCLAEVHDPANRRYRYPFTNCTHCGPRFTITQGLPYDRARTTMSAFEMCDTCRAEYEHPRNRRFHAQPTACPDCGPTLALRHAHESQPPVAFGDDALGVAVAALRAGHIVAIKGLGGYHLACDALDPNAVRRLRARKHREGKPFGTMIASVAAARTFCTITDDEAALLESHQRPIVLLARRDDLDDVLQRALHEVAGGCGTLGVMLPYTPLHDLLLADFGGPLVMTSGNRSDEPIAIHDDEAIARLADIADCFLTHDRPIVAACDDSVLCTAPTHTSTGAATSRVMFLRRSRGFAPQPLALPRESPEPIIATGGHQKNTFCIVRGDSVFVSQHIGDLAHPSAYGVLRAEIARHEQLFRIRPRVVAHDLHPDYLSTRVAEELPATRRIAVQHHHAHIAACLAEHGVVEPALGIALDGAGLGTDGAIWGGEFLLVDGAAFSRLGHIGYVPLPGGDAAARLPWRAAASHLWATFDGDVARAPAAWTARRDTNKLHALCSAFANRALSPSCSSTGRLFDAVASIIGLRDESQFEAQAAMELEAIADKSTTRTYPVKIDERSDGWVIDCAPLIRAVADDVHDARAREEIAGAFHNAVRDLVVAGAVRAREQSGISRVALSGGVFQNVRLAVGVFDALTERGFKPMMHERVPANDGGLALGQAWVATCMLREAATLCV